MTLAVYCLVNLLENTVDLEIFVVKIFSWFVYRPTTKIKKHEIYFIITVNAFLYTRFHSTAS